MKYLFVQSKSIEPTVRLLDITRAMLTKYQNVCGLFSLRINEVTRFIYSIRISN